MKKSFFGKLDNGKDVYAYVISDGKLSATILDYGATVQSLKFEERNVVFGYDSIEEYVSNDGYFGATIGRYAGRIANASFKLNGKRYRLKKNEGENCLHGGPLGFDKAIWSVDEKNGYGDDFVEMTRSSKRGENGFPGNLTVKVRFYVKGGTFGITYAASSDKDTYINLTNHSYFNILETRDLDFCLLKLNSNEYCEVGDDLVPLGTKKSVVGTPMDFRWAKSITKDIDADYKQLRKAKGYDHNFVINGSGFRQCAELSSTVDGLKMTCFTDRPNVQFYSGNFITPRKIQDGAIIGKRGAICLETQGTPNSMNVGNKTADLLKAGEEFQSTTEYRFSRFD